MQKHIEMNELDIERRNLTWQRIAPTADIL